MGTKGKGKGPLGTAMKGAYASMFDEDDDDDGFGAQEPAFGGCGARQAAGVFVPSHAKGKDKGKGKGAPFGKGKGKAKGYAFAADEPWRGPPSGEAQDAVFHRINQAIWKGCDDAAKGVAHMLTDWTEDQLVKRLCKYMNKAATTVQYREQEWDEVIREFVVNMFGGGYGTCGEEQWFFHIDLIPVVAGSCLELLYNAGWQITADKVYEAATFEYENALDDVTRDKALWQMAQAFGDDEKAKSKVWNALSKTYKPALDEVVNDPRPMQDLLRVELFTKRWLHDSACRMWTSLENAEEVLTPETVGELFSNLLAPFGTSHPFSCIPRVLTSRIGPPPPDWPFIADAVTALFAEWSHEANRSAKKRRKKTKTWDEDEWGAQEGDSGNADDLGQAVEAKPYKPKVKKAAWKASNPDGHPRCTSAEDCAGTPETPLIRHVLEDGPGDLYCQVCWNSFKQRNPELEGVEEEI